MRVDKLCVESHATRDCPLSLLAAERPLYIVHRSPDRRSHWTYNLRVLKCGRLCRRGRFYVVLYTDWHTQSERVLVVPSELLVKEVFPHVLERDGLRYMLQISKRTFEITWQVDVRMDGYPFLVGNDMGGVRLNGI